MSFLHDGMQVAGFVMQTVGFVMQMWAFPAELNEQWVFYGRVVRHTRTLLFGNGLRNDEADLEAGIVESLASSDIRGAADSGDSTVKGGANGVQHDGSSVRQEPDRDGSSEKFEAGLEAKTVEYSLASSICGEVDDGGAIQKAASCAQQDNSAVRRNSDLVGSADKVGDEDIEFGQDMHDDMSGQTNA